MYSIKETKCAIVIVRQRTLNYLEVLVQFNCMVSIYWQFISDRMFTTRHYFRKICGYLYLVCRIDNLLHLHCTMDIPVWSGIHLLHGACLLRGSSYFLFEDEQQPPWTIRRIIYNIAEPSSFRNVVYALFEYINKRVYISNPLWYPHDTKYVGNQDVLYITNPGMSFCIIKCDTFH